MPSVSKKQFRYMKALEHGDIKNSSLSPEKAKEWTEGMTKERWKKLKEKIGVKK